MNTLAFRFDVDSVRCCREGIPRLIELADRLGVRFTFFLNLGYTFNWKHTLAHVARKQLIRAAPGTPRHASLSTLAKLRPTGVIETMLLNPQLGRRFKTTFDQLFEAGHELGLHGGTDHALWQRALSDLSDRQLENLLRPAYESFRRDYGAPRGFASPGFRHDDRVLRMTDSYGFEYGADMPGDRPFRPRVGGCELAHYQVPVNVAGSGSVPLVEQMLALGKGDAEIVRAAASAIRERRFALMYGHPFVEGVRADLIERIARAVEDTHEVVTVREYLMRWRRRGQDPMISA